jgi:hypothetical protein
LLFYHSTVFVSVLLVSHFKWHALPLCSSFLLCLLKVDYKVKVRGGKEKVVHVNMLKVWNERVEKDKDNDVQTDIAACLNVIPGLSTDEGRDDSEMNPAISPALQRKESVDEVHISNREGPASILLLSPAYLCTSLY